MLSVQSLGNMRLLEKIEERGISPVIGTVFLVAIVVLLAALITILSFGLFDNQESGSSGVKTTDSEFSVVTMQTAERLIFKRSDGKLYYADQAGERITPKPGEYTVIAQSKDGTKNVIRKNVKADVPSLVIDSFDNNKAKPVKASNDVEKEIKLVNLKKDDVTGFASPRYITPPIENAEIDTVERISIETGSSQSSAQVRVDVMTNFGEAISMDARVSLDEYTVKETFGKNAEKSFSPSGQREALSLFTSDSYGEQFEQEAENGKHGDTFAVRVETNDPQNTDVERITVYGKGTGDPFDTPRPLNAPEPEERDPSAKIVSTNSPFNEAEGDSRIKATGEVVNMEGKFAIVPVVDGTVQPLIPKEFVVNVQSGEQKTVSFNQEVVNCDPDSSLSFALAEVEKNDGSGPGPTLGDFSVKDVKDSVSYKIKCTS